MASALSHHLCEHTACTTDTRFLYSALGQLLSTHISATAPCTLPIKAALFLYSVSSSLPAPPPQPVSVFIFFFALTQPKNRNFPWADSKNLTRKHHIPSRRLCCARAARGGWGQQPSPSLQTPPNTFVPAFVLQGADFLVSFAAYSSSNVSTDCGRSGSAPHIPSPGFRFGVKQQGMQSEAA